MKMETLFRVSAALPLTEKCQLVSIAFPQAVLLLKFAGFHDQSQVSHIIIFF